MIDKVFYVARAVRRSKFERIQKGHIFNEDDISEIELLEAQVAIDAYEAWEKLKLEEGFRDYTSRAIHI